MQTVTEQTTREEAIAILVEMDVAQWGEAERAASQASHAKRTIGLALNEIANRYLGLGNEAEAKRVRKLAKLSRDDRKSLRGGG